MTVIWTTSQLAILTTLQVWQDMGMDMKARGRKRSGTISVQSTHLSGSGEAHDTKIGILAGFRNGLFITGQQREAWSGLAHMTTTKHDSGNVGVTMRPTSNRR
jgi:hypothetical protein